MHVKPVSHSQCDVQGGSTTIIDCDAQHAVCGQSLVSAEMHIEQMSVYVEGISSGGGGITSWVRISGIATGSVVT